MYDVTNEKTFANISNWLRNIEDHAKEDVEKIIVGNKTDLENQRRVSTAKGQKMAIEYGLKLIETSAKVRFNRQNRNCRKIEPNITNVGFITLNHQPKRNSS